MLTAGTAYWLSIFNTSGPGVDDDWFWFFSSPSATAASRSGPTGGWGAMPNRLDFQILGEPVPEPASMLLLGSGLAGLWVARRRRA